MLSIKSQVDIVYLPIKPPRERSLINGISPISVPCDDDECKQC